MTPTRIVTIEPVPLQLDPLDEARAYERQGSLRAAVASYERVAAAAERSGRGNNTLAAHALNAVGAIHLLRGSPTEARSACVRALDLAVTCHNFPARAFYQLAVATRAVLSEAESARKLALRYQSRGRFVDALSMLNAAHCQIRRVDPRVDATDVRRKVVELEATYRVVVRAWGRSVESRDESTIGHSERVARLALALARTLELGEQDEMCVLLGAYLHDVGKSRVPQRILNKPGTLTSEERAVVRQHPRWGVELLQSLECPWDVRSVIHCHHEHYNGSGYPDQLRGEEIPLAAQIVGIADVYDALTTARSYRARLSEPQALAVITRVRDWWSPRVFTALQRFLAPGAAPA